MEENKVATDSSAPNAPELTRLSGEQAEERAAREGRAKEWLLAKTVPWNIGLDGVAKLVSTYAESECSRLASRVEELESGFRQLRVYLSSGWPNGDYAVKLIDRFLPAPKVVRGAGAHAEEKSKWVMD